MKNFDLPTINSRNTFNRLMFTLPSRSSYLLTGATIVMQIRAEVGAKAVDTYSTIPNGHITIVGEYSFEIEEHVVYISPDIYYYDILIIFDNGKRKAWIGGKWMIDQIITFAKQ